MPFISWISPAKQNREIMWHKYHLQASISNCVVLIRQNKGAKTIWMLSRQLLGQPN